MYYCFLTPIYFLAYILFSAGYFAHLSKFLLIFISHFMGGMYLLFFKNRMDPVIQFKLLLGIIVGMHLLCNLLSEKLQVIIK